MSPTTMELLQQESNRTGLSLQPAVCKALSSYLDLLAHWGKRINLTAKPEVAHLVQHHLVDAFFLASLLSARHAPAASSGQPALRCVDVGSGAGLPAIPLAILLPWIHLTLIEPNQRKCSFLRLAIHELQLAATLCAQRVEQTRLEPFDLALSRATWSAPEWLARALVLTRDGGEVVAFIAKQEEMAPPPPALSELQRTAYQLADGTPRCIVVFQKLSEIPYRPWLAGRRRFT